MLHYFPENLLEQLCHHFQQMMHDSAVDNSFCTATCNQQSNTITGQKLLFISEGVRLGVFIQFHTLIFVSYASFQINGPKRHLLCCPALLLPWSADSSSVEGRTGEAGRLLLAVEIVVKFSDKSAAKLLFICNISTMYEQQHGWKQLICRGLEILRKNKSYGYVLQNPTIENECLLQAISPLDIKK